MGFLATRASRPDLSRPKPYADNVAHGLGIGLGKVLEHRFLPGLGMHQRTRKPQSCKDSAISPVPQSYRKHRRHALARHGLAAFQEDMVRLQAFDDANQLIFVILAFQTLERSRASVFLFPALRHCKVDGRRNAALHEFAVLDKRQTPTQSRIDSQHAHQLPPFSKVSRTHSNTPLESTQSISAS